MTISELPTLKQGHFQNATPLDVQLSDYQFKWRQKQLWVRRCSHRSGQPYLPALDNKAQLVDCLKHSPIALVRLDANLGDARLKHWADACEQAGKAIYLWVPTAPEVSKRQQRPLWWLKRLLDWSLAALLVTFLSPLLMALALIVRLDSPGPILFRQWRVGERGRIFRIYKFRTMWADAEKRHHEIMANQQEHCLHKHPRDPRITPVGRWMRRYSLDELPQLFNVLLGEMSLVGPRPWALYDAVRISPAMQPRLNALPGITGAWQVEMRSTLLDLDMVNRRDLEYLRNWSLGQDLKILLLTVPRVLTGFGAY